MARSMRKVRIGSVVRTAREKTAVVEMVWKQRHRLYRKQMRRVARFQVHDPENRCQLGDLVRIEETRPISKTKHWRLMEIIQSRQVADVAPMELESDAVIVTPEADAVEDTPADVVDDPSSADPAAGDSPEETPTGDTGDDAPEAAVDTPTNEADDDAPEAGDETPVDVVSDEAPAEDAVADETSAVASDESTADQETQEEDETSKQDVEVSEAQEDEDGQR